jgi:hypothetical protein
MDTSELAQGFIGCTLPKALWTHEAHLRVGLWHALRHPEAETLALLRERIRRYNAAAGGENTATAGYHESITRFYVTLFYVYLAAADAGQDAAGLEAGLLERYGDRDLPLQYYHRETLSSSAARLGWVEPDRAPLPQK